MKKAINAWTIPQCVPFEDMFRQVSEAGFHAIELNIDAQDASCHSLTMDSGRELYDQINGLVQRYNLPVCSISTSLYGGTLGSDDPTEQEYGKGVLRKQLECARALGADAILVVPGGISESVSIQKATQNSRHAISQMIGEIEGAKIAAGLENVWNGFFASPTDMAAFIDSFGSSYIRAYFDVGNVAAFSYPEYWIEILGPRICKVHVKDYLRTGGWHSGCWANLLQGSIRWDRVTASLRQAGYAGHLTAELPVLEQAPEYLYEMTSKALDHILYL